MSISSAIGCFGIIILFRVAASHDKVKSFAQIIISAYYLRQQGYGWAQITIA
jgi:hypothetical protein